MAERPVYKYCLDKTYCKEVNIEFIYNKGFAPSQKLKNIAALHNSYKKIFPEERVLEISTKSPIELGYKLSAFNLQLRLNNGKKVAVENVFQSSKVFESGKQYLDLLDCSPLEAKKDERLKNNGNVISFVFDGLSFQTEPKDYFYNWIYISALNQNKQFYNELLEYDAFTDIEFNPKKSLNCQAAAVARFVGLYKSNMLVSALKNPNEFLNIVYRKDDLLSYQIKMDI